MQEDTSFRGDVIGLCISIKGRHTEGKGRHQRGLSFNIVDYSEDRSFYTTEQIGDMPHWIDQQKNAILQQTNATPVPIEINKMSYNQRVAFNIIRDHFLGSTNDQLFMILTGLGGSGKSFVIQAVTNLVNEQCNFTGHLTGCGKK